MNPGELKQHLTFQKPSEEMDKEGIPIDQPTFYLNARAKLNTLKGKSFYAAATTNMEHNRAFTIRYRKELMDEVRPKGLQVLWRGIVHEITSIENDDGLNRTLSVHARAVS